MAVIMLDWWWFSLLVIGLQNVQAQENDNRSVIDSSGVLNSQEQEQETLEFIRTALNECRGDKDFQQEFMCQERAEFGVRFDLHHAPPCYCDSGCKYFGDCCFDQLDNSEQEQDINVMASCLTWEKDSQVTASMIDRCPRNYQDSFISDRCQRRVIDGPIPYLHTQDLPFHSLATHRTYANQYCALCHNDAEQPMLAGSMSLVCDTQDLINECKVSIFDNILTDGNYLPGTLTWKYSLKHTKLCREKEEEEVTCRLDIGLDLDQLKKDGVRFCNEDVVNKCSEDFSEENGETERLCGIYSLGLETEEGRFKNPHCAQCNFANVTSDRFCYLDLLQHDLSIQSPIMTSECSDPGCVPPLVQIIIAIAGNFQRCLDGQFWSQVHKKCYDIVCGTNFIFEDGECVKRTVNETGGDEKFNAAINSSCFLIEVDSEFIQDFGNGTILLTELETTRGPGEYEPFQKLEDGQVGIGYRVCSEVSVRPDAVQGVIGYISRIINIVALSLHILLYVLLKKLRNQPAHYLFCLSISMLLADLASVVNSLTAEKSIAFCLILTVSTHYFLLAKFYWMNILSFDICRTFALGKCLGDGALRDQGKSAAKKRLFLYSCYAWGVPLLIVLLTHILPQVGLLEDIQPQYGTLTSCILNDVIVLLLYLILPMFVVIVGNVVFFLITMVSIIKQQEASSLVHSSSPNGTSARNGTAEADDHKKQLVKLFTIYVKLATLMGIGWLILLIGVTSVKHPWISNVYTLVVNLQGVCIFVFFDLKRKVFFALYEKITGRAHPSSTGNKKTSSTENEHDNGTKKKGQFVRSLLERFSTRQSATSSSNLAMSSTSTDPSGQ